MKKNTERNRPRREDAHFGQNALVFEGIVSLRALLEGGRRPIEKVLVTRGRAAKNSRELGFLKAKAAERGFALEITDDDSVERLATGNTHGGLLALCGEYSLPDRLPDDIGRGFFVLLDGVEDPYNFGYALRSLYAAGADCVLLPPRSWMSAAGIVCRASAGASERLTLCACESADAVTELKARGFSIVCADIDDSVPVYDAALKLPLLLIVGGEKRGISRPLREAADAVVRLDYGRPFDAALSAASAASILAFEVFRQNREILCADPGRVSLP